MNTEINLRVGSEREIRAGIENASEKIAGFEGEFRVMARGEAILTASYREMPLPVKIPLYDKVFERDKAIYKSSGTKKKKEKHVI
jgi:hypothetical protein